MAEKYSVTLEKIIKNHNLEVVYVPKPTEEILITTSEVNDPV